MARPQSAPCPRYMVLAARMVRACMAMSASTISLHSCSRGVCWGSQPSTRFALAGLPSSRSTCAGMSAGQQSCRTDATLCLHLQTEASMFLHRSIAKQSLYLVSECPEWKVCKGNDSLRGNSLPSMPCTLQCRQKPSVQNILL